MSDFCGFAVALFILAIPILFIMLIISLVRRNKVKMMLILLLSDFVLIIIFTLIGTYAWTQTEEYQESFVEEKQASENIESSIVETEENIKKVEDIEGGTAETKENTESRENSKKETVESMEVLEDSNFTDEKEHEEIEKAYLKIPEKYINDLTLAMNQVGMSISSISDVKKMKDWNNGERYKIYYGNFMEVEYIVYFFDDGKVASINNSMNDKIYESTDTVKDNNVSGNIIRIVDGQKGQYGQIDDFSGYETIRYYLPYGKYLVTCQTRGSGFYIESIEKYLEDGFETSEIFEKIVFSDSNEEVEVEIKDGQCISVLINSNLIFEPIK